MLGGTACASDPASSSGVKVAFSDVLGDTSAATLGGLLCAEVVCGLDLSDDERESGSGSPGGVAGVLDVYGAR